MVRPTAAVANNSISKPDAAIGLIVMATHALQRHDINVGVLVLVHLRHIGNRMPGLLQRNSSILHAIEEFSIVTGKAQIHAALIAAD